MAYIGPFLFNGIRFALGTVVLLPFILLRKAKRNSISQPGIPLKQGLLAGLVSVGIAYTLQVVAQKRVQPSHVAIIMSLEAVFALVGGWILLGEHITLQGTAGGVLMLTAMMLSSTGKPGLRRNAKL